MSIETQQVKVTGVDGEEKLSTSPVDVKELPESSIAAAVASAPHSGQNGIHVKGGDERRGEEKTNGGYRNGNGESSSSSNSRSSSGHRSQPEANGKDTDALINRPSLTGSLHSHPSIHTKSQTMMPTTTRKGIHKRIIICCDGTWQDGIEKKYRWQYSNILKLTRAFQLEDQRHDPPIKQIVFYQSGVGSDHNLYSEVMGGATGAGLGDKVQDAYAFVAHNYAQGDEVFLIGFSRGAYTARMVADFIGAIGILDKSDMDHFAELFLAYQKLGKMDEDDAEEKARLQKRISPFTDPNSRGKRNAEATEGKFMIKCLAVFDTVGSVGLPGELLLGSPKTQLFGFNDLKLGAHVERALQALALNERRKDFSPATWTQGDEGKERGQVLHQCWFTGSHSDVGGGYEFHDLSDLTLTWMVANFEDIVAVNMDYIRSLFHDRHIAPYGEQYPHDSGVGVFALADSQNRPLPSTQCDSTQQTIHPSALRCKSLRPDLSTLVQTKPDLVWKLLPLEELVQKSWTYNPMREPLSEEAKDTAKEEVKAQKSFVDSFKQRTSGIFGSLGRAAGVRKNNSSVKRKSMMEDQGAGPGVKVVKEPSRSLTWFGSVLEGVSG